MQQDKEQTHSPNDLDRDEQPGHEDQDDLVNITKEIGGPKGPEPTRYGDWERKGRCIDF